MASTSKRSRSSSPADGEVKPTVHPSSPKRARVERNLPNVSSSSPEKNRISFSIPNVLKSESRSKTPQAVGSTENPPTSSKDIFSASTVTSLLTTAPSPTLNISSNISASSRNMNTASTTKNSSTAGSSATTNTPPSIPTSNPPSPSTKTLSASSAASPSTTPTSPTLNISPYIPSNTSTHQVGVGTDPSTTAANVTTNISRNLLMSLPRSPSMDTTSASSATSLSVKNDLTRTQYPRIIIHTTKNPELPRQCEVAGFLFPDRISGAASTKRGFTNTLPSGIELDPSNFHLGIVTGVEKVNEADYVVSSFPILSYSKARKEHTSAIHYVQGFEKSALRRHIPLPFKKADGTIDRAPTLTAFGSTLNTGAFIDAVPAWVVCKKQRVLLRLGKSAWHKYSPAELYRVPHEAIQRLEDYGERMDTLDFAEAGTEPQQDEEFDDDESTAVRQLDDDQQHLLQELLLGGAKKEAHGLLQKAIAGRNLRIKDWLYTSQDVF